MADLFELYLEQFATAVGIKILVIGVLFYWRISHIFRREIESNAKRAHANDHRIARLEGNVETLHAILAHKTESQHEKRS